MNFIKIGKQIVSRVPPDFISLILHHLLMGIDIQCGHDDVLTAIALNGIGHCRYYKVLAQYHYFDFNVKAVQED